MKSRDRSRHMIFVGYPRRQSSVRGNVSENVWQRNVDCDVVRMLEQSVVVGAVIHVKGRFFFGDEQVKTDGGGASLQRSRKHIGTTHNDGTELIGTNIAVRNDDKFCGGSIR